MGKFSELGIKNEVKSFIGDKVHMDKILNREITVHDFKIEDSDYKDKGDGKRLCISFSLGGTRHIVFTGSIQLRNMIQQVKTTDFPFDTTIIKENRGLLFT